MRVLTKREKKNALQALYQRTEKGLITTLYGNMRGHAITRGHSAPNFSRSRFILWLTDQPNFRKLFNDWVLSDYKKNLKPSVDRKNDYISYTLKNIQLITWQENNDKRLKIEKKVEIIRYQKPLFS